MTKSTPAYVSSPNQTTLFSLYSTPPLSQPYCNPTSTHFQKHHQHKAMYFFFSLFNTSSQLYQERRKQILSSVTCGHAAKSLKPHGANINSSQSPILTVYTFAIIRLKQFPIYLIHVTILVEGTSELLSSSRQPKQRIQGMELFVELIVVENGLWLLEKLLM